MTNAEKFAFLQSEFGAFKQLQTTITTDIGEIKADVKDIKTALYIKRNGKNSICQTIDEHTDRINMLERVHETQGNRGWDIVKSALASLITAIITLGFFYLFYKP